MPTTTDLVLDHVRQHGRIADLAALARAAGRAPRSVLKALSDLKTRGQVTYVLWDMPIRVVGEPVVHREVKPSNEVEEGEPIAVDEAAHLEREVVQPAEASNTVAKGDMDDAAEQPAEVVHQVPRRRRGLTAALLEHLRTRSGERPEPGAFGVDERQIGVTLAHLRKRGVLSYPASKGGAATVSTGQPSGSSRDPQVFRRRRPRRHRRIRLRRTGSARRARERREVDVSAHAGGVGQPKADEDDEQEDLDDG